MSGQDHSNDPIELRVATISFEGAYALIDGPAWRRRTALERMTDDDLRVVRSALMQRLADVLELVPGAIGETVRRAFKLHGHGGAIETLRGFREMIRLLKPQ